MQADIIHAIVAQIFSIAATVLASGAITTLLTQGLKWKAIAEPAKKYPVPVAVMLSLVVSAAAVYGLNAIPLVNWGSYLVFSAVTLLVATQSYDLVHDQIKKLKATD